MEVVALLVGVGVVALSPVIPALRPAAKAAVAGGIAVADKTKEMVAVTGENWMDLVAEAQAERAAEAAARENVTETITIPLPEDVASD
jgi:hypothetical protein